MSVTQNSLPRVGGQSPWGTIQGADPLWETGCVVATTAGHGGIFVPADLLAHIPGEAQRWAARWSKSAQWYEEDACAAVPVAYLPGIPDEKRARAAEFLRGRYPAFYFADHVEAATLLTADSGEGDA